MGPNPSEPVLNIPVEHLGRGGRSVWTRNVSWKAGDPLTEALRQLERMGLIEQRVGVLKGKGGEVSGHYIGKVDGQAEGKASKENKQKAEDGKIPVDRVREQDDDRTDEEGFGYHLAIRIGGKLHPLVARMENGKLQFVDSDRMVLGEDDIGFLQQQGATIVIYETKIHWEPGKSEDFVYLYDQDLADLKNGKFDKHIRDLDFDYTVGDDAFAPPRLGAISGMMGRDGRRLELGWVDARAMPYRHLDGQPWEGAPGFNDLDGLSPKLMQLAKELEIQKRLAKEKKGPSFAPIYLGFESPGAGFGAPQKDEGSGFDGPTGPGFDDAPSFGSSPAGGRDENKTPKRSVPVRYAQKETPGRKSAAWHLPKMATRAPTQNRVAYALAETMQKIGEQARAALQGMKTGTMAEMPANKQAEKGQATSMRGMEMDESGQTMQKHGTLQKQGQTATEKQGWTQATKTRAESMPTMLFPAPLSEGPQTFVQSMGESAGMPETQTEMTVQQTAVRVSGAPAEAETAQNISYQAGQTMTQAVQNQITAPLPVRGARDAEVVAAEPVKLAVERENKKGKEKAGEKIALAIITAPVMAKKKKTAAIVPIRPDMKKGGKKTEAGMENRNGQNRKKAA